MRYPYLRWRAIDILFTLCNNKFNFLFQTLSHTSAYLFFVMLDDFQATLGREMALVYLISLNICLCIKYVSLVAMTPIIHNLFHLAWLNGPTYHYPFLHPYHPDSILYHLPLCILSELNHRDLSAVMTDALLHGLAYRTIAPLAHCLLFFWGGNKSQPTFGDPEGLSRKEKFRGILPKEALLRYSRWSDSKIFFFLERTGKPCPCTVGKIRTNQRGTLFY